MPITVAEVSQAWAEQALRAQAAEQQLAILIKENEELKKQFESFKQAAKVVPIK